MKPHRPIVSVLISVALTACASSGGQQPEPAGPAPGPTDPGPAAAPSEAPATMAAAGATTFSEAQADRGRDIFRATCTECHYSSEFSDSQFKFKWSRRSAANLYDLIQTSMPETAPGSLSPEETVDIVSYVLRMNGFAAGPGDLAPDPDVLAAISLASIRQP